MLLAPDSIVDIMIGVLQEAGRQGVVHWCLMMKMMKTTSNLQTRDSRCRLQTGQLDAGVPQASLQVLAPKAREAPHSSVLADLAP